MSAGNRLCFFDSGVGGLTVLKEFLYSCIGGEFIYYGDNKNAPYGNKSADEIYSLSASAFKLFERLSPSAVVIACNTVTADCVKRLRGEFPFPIYGIQPALRPALSCSDNALVLTTRATALSESFLSLKNSFYGKKITVFSPEKLAEDIERNIFSLSEINLNEHLPKINVSAVVLGCTHYSYLADEISSYYHAPCFDGNRGLSKHVKNCCSFPFHSKNSVRFLGESAVFNERVLRKIYPRLPPFDSLF